MGWDQLEVATRLIAAAMLGGVIGIERGVRGRSAGLRTQMLVAVGAALAMIVSLHFAERFGDAGGTISIDPARVAYGVMGGIGFLGAGAIMRFGIGIRGLTTAASLWCTAAVGLAAGFGMYGTAAIASGLVLIVLWALRFLDRALPHVRDRDLVVVTSGPAAEAADRVAAMIAAAGLTGTNTGVRRAVDDDTVKITFRVVLRKQGDLATLLRVTDQAEGVHNVTLE
jgi:putative Mg2+ transporter-C (MgtC) family protein